VALNRDQQVVLQAVYDVFAREGAWPVVDFVDREINLRYDLDAHSVLRSLPTELALVDRMHLRDDQPVKLTVRGLSSCDGAKADIELFVRAVRWFAEKEAAVVPKSPRRAMQVTVTSEQLQEQFANEGSDLDSVALAKVWALADVEGVAWGGAVEIDGDPGRWTLHLRRDIRAYRDVITVEDYLRVRPRQASDGPPTSSRESTPPTPHQRLSVHDLFISHASEDKNDVARPLAQRLQAAGWSVWLDELELTVGDSLEGRITDALARSRFGVVILSPVFFSKQWTLRELSGLAAREVGSGTKVILPVWHQISHQDILEHSPVLADKKGVPTSQGLDYVAEELSRALRAEAGRSENPARREPMIQSALDPRSARSAPVLAAQAVAGGGAAEAALALGMVLREKGDLLGAEVEFRRAVESGSREALTPLGLVLRDLGQMDQAETWLRRAVDEEQGPALLALGMVLHERGQLSEAEVFLRRARDVADANHASEVSDESSEDDQIIEARHHFFMRMDDLAVQLDTAVRQAQDGRPNAPTRLASLRERILDANNRELLAGHDMSVGGNLLTSAATTARDAARDDEPAVLARTRLDISKARGVLADEAMGNPKKES
jgi:tetratricopeptide (TPR) repeat protein